MEGKPTIWIALDSGVCLFPRPEAGARLFVKTMDLAAKEPTERRLNE